MLKVYLIALVVVVGCKKAETKPLPAKASSAPVASTPPPAPEIPAWSDAATAFATWAADARLKPNKYGKTEQCYTDEKKKGICARTHTPEQFTPWSIDYVKKNPKAFKFHGYFSNVELRCAGLGKATVVRTWRYASLRKTLCRIEEGKLGGLYALVDYPMPGSAFGPGGNIHLFSPEYLDHSPDFRSVIMTQGL
jgi:hypothetical protein